ncbi:ketopantoate reductase family protein [Nonomuraea glycinis]|jgi:2-dehydropantoate 2-reductase|uniref:ketopantoate reductase family protein n=1 Tax=Nonomuraea glycinis TaxID=2047744 RepID=UPI002E119FAC|nr:hypothetical protein OHA68_15350 [Nonomuraea glycinis]
MRYIVIGAGAIGGTIGARLHQSGHEVLLIARGPHYEALRSDGLRLITPHDDLRMDIPVAAGPVPVREDDVLILATKSQDTVGALDPWPRHLPVVCAQNGVENERVALRRFDRVYGMCVWLPAAHTEPGVVACYGSPRSGLLHIGGYPHGADETAKQIATDLDGSSFVALSSPEVMRWKYGKLLGNLNNAVEALVGHGPGVEEIMEHARTEGMAVLEEAGLPYSTRREERELRRDKVEVVPIGGKTRDGGSSWQSLARGTGSIEADYLNGEIVLLGRELGIPTPANEVLQREANRFALERRRPGSMELETLSALIDERSAAGSH